MINRIMTSIILTIIIMLVIFGTFTITQHSTYAQIPALTTPTPSTSQNQQQSQQSQNSSSVSFVTYKDPQGRFSIDYPSNWTATAATNRFEKKLVTFTPGDGITAFDIYEMGSLAPYSKEDSLKASIASFKIIIPNFDLYQDIECQKYTIEGSKACSIIYTRTTDYTSNIKDVVMAVVLEVNGKAYTIGYGTAPDNFDKLLPTMDKMINSFKAGV